MAVDDSTFFTRWSRRKAQARTGDPVAEPPVPAPAAPVLGPGPAPALAPEAASAPPLPTSPPADAAPEKPPLTLDDVAGLTRESDYTAFVARGVAPDVKNAALKNLFTDPHFNVMDGLDTYIDDYGKPDPLPPGMLRKMVQSQLLGLFDDEKKPAPAGAAADVEPMPVAASAEADPDADLATPPDTAAGEKADDTAALADAAPATLTALPCDTPAHEDPAVQLQPDDDAGRAGLEPGAGQDAGRQH